MASSHAEEIWETNLGMLKGPVLMQLFSEHSTVWKLTKCIFQGNTTLQNVAMWNHIARKWDPCEGWIWCSKVCEADCLHKQNHNYYFYMGSVKAHSKRTGKPVSSTSIDNAKDVLMHQHQWVADKIHSLLFLNIWIIWRGMNTK